MFKTKTPLQQLEAARRRNRLKNGVVEKILALIEKLQSQLEALDAEQDSVNEALLAEKARIKEASEAEIAGLRAQIEAAEKRALVDTVNADEAFKAIAAEAKAEADTVRRVQANVAALTR